MFVFLGERLHCNSQNRRLIIHLQVFFSDKAPFSLNMECLTDALSHCWSDYQHSAQKKQNKKKDGFHLIYEICEVCISSFLFFAFLIYTRPILWLNITAKILKWFLGFALLSLSCPCFLSALFYSTASSTSACDCTPSPEVLLDFSLTFCSLN